MDGTLFPTTKLKYQWHPRKSICSLPISPPLKLPTKKCGEVQKGQRKRKKEKKKKGKGKKGGINKHS